jgi:hypothetical protein
MKFHFEAKALLGLVLFAGTVMSQTPSSDETKPYWLRAKNTAAPGVES